MTEGDGKDSLRGQPSIGHYPDEVLGWEWLEYGYEEIDDMLVLAVFVLEQEVLVMQCDLTVYILYKYPEGLQYNYIHNVLIINTVKPV